MIPKPTYRYNHAEALAAADVARILLQDFYRDQPAIEPPPAPIVRLWRGKRIETLTRDELLECVRVQGDYIQTLEAMPKDFRKMAADKIHEAKK